MLFFSKPKAYLGVDIGAGGIKLVELRQEKNRPVLYTYGFTSDRQDVRQLLEREEKMVKEMKSGKKVETVTEEFSDDKIKKYVGDILSVCRAARTTAKNVVVSLPVSAVFHSVLTIPKLDKDAFNNVLKAEIKKLLPRPVEEIALDYQILPGKSEDKNQRVLVNAVPKNLVNFYSKVFQKAGFILDSLEPESTALARALVGKDPANSLIIDIGAEKTNFFIVDQGAPVTHHSIETGGKKIDKLLLSALGMPVDSIEQVKIDISKYSQLNPGKFDGNLVALLMPVMDPIIKEIEYSLDLFITQSGNENKHMEKIILTGGAAVLPHLADFISEQFKVKCYIGDPWARVVYQDGLKPILNEIGPRMSVAVGLALRNVL